MEACDNHATVESRKLTYVLVSSLFLEEVSEDFLERLAAGPPAAGELGRFVATLSYADLATVRTDAASEFAALLLNMSADPVFPYESVYTSGERLMMQQARNEVLAAYRRQGFERADSVNVPEDHAGIELEFMARLCQKELDALDAGDTEAVETVRAAQKSFLTDHLLRWMFQLCDDLERRAKSSLYRGLAETTRQFLEFEREELA